MPVRNALHRKNAFQIVLLHANPLQSLSRGSSGTTGSHSASSAARTLGQHGWPSNFLNGVETSLSHLQGIPFKAGRRHR